MYNFVLGTLFSLSGVDSGYNSENSLKRQNSLVSVQSSSFPSSTSSDLLAPSDTHSLIELKQKLTELETLKDILFDQLNNLQSHLTEREDNSLTVVNEEKSAEGQQEDFKCKALTFKTTANTFVESVNHCFEIICRPEKLNSKSLNDSKNGSSEPTTDMYCNMLPIDSSTAAAEGIMVEEKDDAEQMINNNFVNMEINKNDDNIWQPSCQLRSHHLWPEIDQVTNEQVQYARMGLGKDAWQLFAEEGEMKMYKREEEQNGLAVDPLKACHFVRGFTAQEICHFFFRPEYRYEWETTLETNGMTVLETMSDDGIIFHQIHKRVWPVAQRDAVFWSHLRRVPLESTDDVSIHDAWVVVNHSTEFPTRPANAGKFVRIFMTVCLFCQTVVTTDKPIEKLTRADIACKITYCSIVNPGGWAPTAALRLIYKREYPRFLRKFTSYVLSKTANNSIMF